jgi:hypothetical protein
MTAAAQATPPSLDAGHFREMLKSTRARWETKRGMPGTNAGFTPITNF